MEHNRKPLKLIFFFLQPVMLAVLLVACSQERSASTDSVDNKTLPSAVTTQAPAVTTPLIQIATPIFSQLKGYSEFNSELRYAFSTALTNEFNSVYEDKMGISVAVYQNGKLWSMTEGMATIDRPLYVETPFAVMSTSKTFLSALILSQIEEYSQYQLHANHKLIDHHLQPHLFFCANLKVILPIQIVVD